MVKTMLTQREADSLNLMAITEMEAVWEDTARAALSHLQDSCHLRAGMSMVHCAASRGLGVPAVCPGGQRLGSGTVPW